MDDFADFLQYIEEEPYDYVVVPRLVLRDAHNPIERYTNSELIERFRFDRETIQQFILLLVYPERQNNINRGLPIPPIIKLMMALRFYASGSYQRVCGDIQSISQASMSRIITEVSEKLARRLPQYIKFPAAQLEVAENRNEFFRIARFPGVLGCVDGTHIEIKSPGGENGEVYRNRKGWMSLNIQVVAGARGQIFDIVIRWPGSAHDSRIFENSAVKLRLEQGQLKGILLGDSAYAQSRYLYTPVPNPSSDGERRYNSSHIRTRNVVERTFGRWKGMFRCLAVPLQYKTKKVTRIIAATAILHNIHIQRNINLIVEDVEERIVPNPPLQVAQRGQIFRNNFIERHFN